MRHSASMCWRDRHLKFEQVYTISCIVPWNNLHKYWQIMKSMHFVTNKKLPVPWFFNNHGNKIIMANLFFVKSPSQFQKRNYNMQLWASNWLSHIFLWLQNISVHYKLIVFISRKCKCSKQNKNSINPLRPSDAIWRKRSGSTLAQVMVCCLMAPSHYLNQCWLIISKVEWH